MANEKGQSIAHGAMIITAGGIIVKLLGACFKIPLGGILGPEGMASFSIAYNIYALLFVISTAGVPTAVSKMISEASALGGIEDEQRIYKVSYVAFALVGLVAFLISMLAAPGLSALMGSRDSFLAVRMISPAVLFVAVSGVNRGYFQGRMNMYPTAISEIIEAFVKTAVGLSVAIYLKGRGFSENAVVGGAVFGVSAGAFASALYFSFLKSEKIKKRKKEKLPYGKILSRLMRLSVPITLGAAIVSLSNVIDSALVMNTLQKSGYELSKAKWLYGSYANAANLFNLPSSLVIGFSAVLVPKISAAYIRKENKLLGETVSATLKVSLLVATAAGFGLCAVSDGVLALLYGRVIEAESVRLSAQMLSVLSLSVPFVCLVSVTNSVHQALGNVKLPVISLSVGALVKIVANIILVRQRDINIMGAPLATLFCYFSAAVVNVAALRARHLPGVKILRIVVKPLVVGAATGAAAYFTQNRILPAVSVIISVPISVFAGVFAFLLTVFLLRALSENDKNLLFSSKKYSIL